MLGVQKSAPAFNMLNELLTDRLAEVLQLDCSSRVLDVEAPSSSIVFCRTRNEVDELTETLNARGQRAEALHGGFSQE